MFDFDTDVMYEGLDDETRVKVATVLNTRAEYLSHQAEMHRRKVALLHNPSKEGYDDLAEFSSAVVAPIRKRLNEEVRAVADEVIDIEQMQAMLPMVLMALSASVNIPLLMMLTGFDPDMVRDGLSHMKSYLSSDMP